MTDLTRPKNIPQEAFWCSSDKEWQAGEYNPKYKKKKIPIGQWRYWREDGSLACIANFNEDGEQSGLTERYHPDGTLASQGYWQNGCRHGHFVFIQSDHDTTESYPANYHTWRYEFDSTRNWEENNPQWFLQDGTPCTSTGKPLSTAFDLDARLDQLAPENFLDTYSSLKSEFFPAKDYSTAPIAQATKELWGITPEKLEQFLACISEGDGFTPATTIRTFDHNIWVDLISHPWENSQEELAAVFSGAIKIGSFGDSDGVYYTLFQPRYNGSPNGIYWWSHETYHLDEVLSLSLDNFAYQATIAKAYAEERLSSQGAAKAWAKLADKINVGWELTSGLSCLIENEDQEEFTPERFHTNLDTRRDISGWFYQAQWIINLLQADSERNWKDIKRSFRPSWNLPYTAEEHTKLLLKGNTFPPLAIYLLWRNFFFAQEARLNQCQTFYAHHPAKIVQDLVEFLKQVQNGHKEIGGIKDLLALRQTFLELDFLPEQAKERAKESQALKTHEENRLEHLTSIVIGPNRGNQEALLNLAWLHVGNPKELALIEEALRQIPGHEKEWQAFDFLNSELIRREQNDPREEIEAIGQWLGSSHSHLLQPFAWGALFQEPPQAQAMLLPAMGTTFGAYDERLIKECLSALEIQEEYQIKRTLAVDILGLARERNCLKKLCRLIDEFLETTKGKADFEARMALIPWETLLKQIATTLNSLADEKYIAENATTATLVRQTLEALGSFSLNNYAWPLAAEVLEALTAWGEHNVLPALGKLLSANDTGPICKALQILESQAAYQSKESLQSFIFFTCRNPDESDNAVTLAYYRAVIAIAKAFPDQCEEPISLEEALREAEELETSGESWKTWRILKARTIGDSENLPLDLIEDQLSSPDHQTRQATEQAFRQRGKEFPQKTIFSWPKVWSIVEGKTISEAACDLSKQLAAPGGINKTAAHAWHWQNPTDEAAEALAKLTEKTIEKLTPPGSGESFPSEITWLMRALARHCQFQPTKETLKKYLSSKHTDIRNAILLEVDSLTTDLAPTLVKLAQEDDAFARYTIAGWLLRNKEEPTVKEALEKTRLSEKKLKLWAK